MSELQRLAFDVDEYRRRVRRVQAILAERDLDALLCHHFPNICYLTGMESVLWTKYFLAVVPREGDPILLGQAFELPNALYCVWTEDQRRLRPRRRTRSRRRVGCCATRGLADKRLGIETAHPARPGLRAAARRAAATRRWSTPATWSTGSR